MPDTPKPIPYLSTLCMVLAVGAAIFAGIGIWMITLDGIVYGLIAIAAGVVMGAAALGLYRQRRWGAAIFGLLAGLGSINHLANVVARYPAETLQNPGTVAAAAVSLLVAILIPAALMYLTLVLWRHSR